MMTVPAEKAPAKYVPAAAVIRMGQALSAVPAQEAPANYVPAAAVIRRGQALSGFTGCKGSADGRPSQV